MNSHAITPSFLQRKAPMPMACLPQHTKNTEANMIITEKTRMKWAIHPAEIGNIKYIDGLFKPEKAPHAGDIITRPFLVDPASNQPVPVRIVEIQECHIEGQHILAVVVTRADRNH